MNITTQIRKNYEETANILRTISHPIRLAILDILLDSEEECVCHMEAILGYRQAYLSQHLMALRKAGIVIDRREGRNIYYSICDKRFGNLIKPLKELSGQKDNSSLLAADCPCPRCKRFNDVVLPSI